MSPSTATAPSARRQLRYLAPAALAAFIALPVTGCAGRSTDYGYRDVTEAFEGYSVRVRLQGRSHLKTENHEIRSGPYAFVAVVDIPNENEVGLGCEVRTNSLVLRPADGGPPVLVQSANLVSIPRPSGQFQVANLRHPQKEGPPWGHNLNIPYVDYVADLDFTISAPCVGREVRQRTRVRLPKAYQDRYITWLEAWLSI